MKEKLKNSIKLKILVIPMIMMFAIITVIASISIVISKNKILSQMQSDGINMANQISKDMGRNDIAESNLNESIEERIRTLAKFVIANKTGVSNDYLKTLAKQFDVSEINVADSNGKIIYSNLESSLSYSYTNSDAAFSVLKGEKEEIMENIRKSTGSDNYYKYGSVRDPQGGIVQVGIEANNVKKLTDSLETQTLINDMVKNKSIVYAVCTDENFKIEADSNKSGVGQTLKNEVGKDAVKKGKVYCSSNNYKNKINVYDIMAPIYKDGKLIGAINIGMSMKNVDAAVYNTIFIIALAAIIAFCLFAFVLIRTSRGIIVPLNDLVGVSKMIAGGELNNDIKVNSKDEIGVLAGAFKDMSENLKDTISVIKKGTVEVNKMSSELSSNSNDMKSSASGVATAIQEVAKGTTEQSNDLVSISDITSNFAKELDDMSKKLSKVSDGSDFTKAKAQDGNEKINTLLKSINEVNNLFNLAADRIESLSKSVSKVGEITGVISGISEETNLLALNAAIEAARAGEAGRGFSVVAEEVRKLAGQSKNSTKEISDLVVNITEDTKNVITTSDNVKNAFADQSEIVKNTMKSFEDMLTAIENVTPLINHTYSSVGTIMKSKDTILSKVESLTAVSEETSASSEEISASSEELYASSESVSNYSQKLSDVAEKLDKSVNKFKL